MTLTKLERSRRHHAKARGEYVPELQRGRPPAPPVIDYAAVPRRPSRQLRKLQLVRRWDVVTGRVEERWE